MTSKNPEVYVTYHRSEGVVTNVVASVEAAELFIEKSDFSSASHDILGPFAAQSVKDVR